MTLLVVPIVAPYRLGIYDEGGSLRESIEGEGKFSDTFLTFADRCLKRYPIERLLYVRGPGSHMATKLAYVTLQTLSIVRGIPFYGCSAFDVNGGKPVKAMGSLYFVKEKETIITKKLSASTDTAFVLPERLDIESLCGDATPDYRLPAV